jgi:hypothetical protein
VVAIHRREQQHGDGEKEPEPRQPVAPDQKTGFGNRRMTRENLWQHRPIKPESYGITAR